MSGARVLEGEGTGATLRWGACLVLVLGLHAGLVMVLLRRAPLPALPVAAPDAVMLELAPAPAPAQPPAQDTPPQPAAPPLPTPELPLPVEPPPVRLPNPAVALPEPPPPPPAPKRPVPPWPAPRPQPPRPAQASPPGQASEAPAPSVAPASAPPPAAPAAASSPSALPGWRSELVGRLQRAKRYPGAAQARDEQGAAAVTFTIDRSGHVLSARLVRSSSSEALDEEAVAMVHRADPLPPVPAELPGGTLTLTVPVTFSLR